MSARLLRGLTRKLHRYHRPAILATNAHVPVPTAGADIHEALDLARAELNWLHEGAREDVVKGRAATAASTAYNLGPEGRQIARRLVELVRRRVVEHEPVAYILGSQPFGPLDLAIRPPTLIPRPETEEWALRLASILFDSHQPGSSQPLRLLDLCSGSGCVGLLMAHIAASANQPLQVTCVDVSSQAITLIRENIQRNALSHAKISVKQADLFSSTDMQRLAVDGAFDVVICNPPYITFKEYEEELDESVRAWEDRRALVGDADEGVDDGLIFYRRLADLLPTLTRRSAGSSRLPFIVVEVGKGQAPSVCDIFSRSPTVERCETWQDAWGVQRVVLAYPRSSCASL